MSDFDDVWQELESALADEEVPLSTVYDSEIEFGSDAAIEPLLALLDDGDLRRVFAAALGLAQFVDACEVIVPRLVPHLLDPHPLVVEHACWTLNQLGGGAMPLLLDAYASHPERKLAIAHALSWRGPRAAAAAMILDDDATRDAAIAEARREIVGPWPEAPEQPMPYLGETIRMDGYGPPSRDRHHIEIWLEILDWHGRHEPAVWDRAARPEIEVHLWRPYRIAIAAPSIVIGAYDGATNDTATATLHADDGARFTNEELLWKLRDAHHRIAPTNDRIFEGLRREDDGSYYIHTGS